MLPKVPGGQKKTPAFNAVNGGQTDSLNDRLLRFSSAQGAMELDSYFPEEGLSLSIFRTEPWNSSCQSDLKYNFTPIESSFAALYLAR